jgi:hypothetical protein
MNKSLLLLCFLTLIISCANRNSSNNLQENAINSPEVELTETDNNLASSNDEYQTDQETTLYEGEGDYIPINETNKIGVSFVLHYSYLQGANRPSLEVKFYDGFELYFNSVCEGDYFWCIRNENNEEIGFMKLTFEQNGEIAIVRIKRNHLSDNYAEYLDLLIGKLHKR